MPNFELMLQFENGTINDDDFITLFQEILDTKAYQWLQGYYGRTCEDLLNQGLIK